MQLTLKDKIEIILLSNQKNASGQNRKKI